MLARAGTGLDVVEVQARALDSTRVIAAIPLPLMRAGRKDLALQGRAHLAARHVEDAQIDRPRRRQHEPNASLHSGDRQATACDKLTRHGLEGRPAGS